MSIIRSMAALSALVTLGACASIIEGTHDKVRLKTNPETAADCTVKNERGAWDVASTPGQTKVDKSKTDLNIECTDKSTGSSGSQTVESTMEPWVLGNVLLGGVIGLGVDFATGGAWNYPKDITVQMSAPATTSSTFLSTPDAAPQAAAPESSGYFIPSAAAATPGAEPLAQPAAADTVSTQQPAVIAPAPAAMSTQPSTPLQYQ